ncbi:hypothetical protein BROUX41_004446 [Berkeleyomyces rouxiae]|uniref:uncharacterized protein n=1 Tax=Berkeleyomyces rouxiae TaxID=2035830 RepID=UPI003B768F15
MAPAVRLFNPTTDAHLVPYLAAVHANCITSDHTIATFLPPLSHDKLLTWWKDSISAVTRGNCAMLLLLDQPAPVDAPGAVPSHLDSSALQVKGSELMGVVMMTMDTTETSPFRAQVEKLLVSPRFRRRGGATALMEALEKEAVKRGRKLLILSTESGSPGEQLYHKLGWSELGQVPNHDLSPSGGLRPATFFYKQLY